MRVWTRENSSRQSPISEGTKVGHRSTRALGKSDAVANRKERYGVRDSSHDVGVVECLRRRFTIDSNVLKT